MMQNICKGHRILGTKQKRTGLFQITCVEKGRFFSVKMYPHQRPWVRGAALVRIGFRTIQPHAVAGCNIKTAAVIRDISAALEHNENEIGAQILPLADMRLQTLQRSDFLDFCHFYDSNPFVCGMGKDNLFAQGERG